MSGANYQTGCVHHWRDQGDCQRYQNYDYLITGLPDLSQEHKYAVFWEPDRITWYIDDKEVLMKYDPVYTPHLLTNVILQLDIDNRGANYSPDPTTPFPAYMLINYFNAYQLLPDCNTDEIFWGIAFDPLTYNYAVKKTVSFGGTACTAPSTINTSSNVSLWATDYILLDEGTTINDNGSGSFMAKITKCPN
jgi:beta-glucanase (GH16 family)